MKTYIDNFKTLRKELRCLFYLSLIVILLSEYFVFRNDFLKIIANILVRLSYSYISALLFYYLVVHYKRQNEKRMYYSVVNERLNYIFLEEKLIVDFFFVLNGDKYFNKTDKVELSAVLKLIRMKDPFTNMSYAGKGMLTFLHHLLEVTNKTRREINILMGSSQFLDIELVKGVSNLDNNQLFRDIELFSQVPNLSNSTMDCFKESFIDYFLIIESLRTYRQKEISKYITEVSN